MAYHRETYNVTPGGVSSELILEHDQVVLREHQHVKPILDENARMRSQVQFGTKIGGMKLAARVPAITYAAWRREYRETAHKHGITWNTFRAIKLNSRDFSEFRVDPGKLSTRP